MALQQDFRVKRGLVVSEGANVVGNAAVSGRLTVSNTAALGNTTITGFINVSSTATTGNITVSGFANVSGTVNANALTVGTSLVANSSGVHLGLANLSSSSLVIDDSSNSTVVTTQPSIFLGGTQWLTGTVTTNGTTTVTGTGTLFTSELQIGDSVRVNGNETTYAVASIANNTSLTTSVAIPTATTKTFQRIPTASITANATVLKGTLTVYNAANFNRSANVGGALGVQGTLGVQGATTLSNTLSVTGGATFSNTLSTTGAATFSNNVTISGNLIVSGTTTYVNTATLNVSDNIVTLNADVPVGTAPTESAGIEVNRGNAANSSLIWDETNDRWTATGNTGLSGAVAEIHIGGTGAANLAVDNAGGTVLQDLAINVDGFGHLRTITAASANLDARYLGFSTVVAGNSSQANVVADLYNDVLTLANGAGVTITTNATTDSITFAHSDTSAQANVSVVNGNGNVLQGISLKVDEFGHVVEATTSSTDLDTRYTRTAFANINVSGQTTIVADGVADVLTLAGAGTVSITTDASTDTITITGATQNSTLSNIANTVANRGLIQLTSVASNTTAGFVGAGSVVVSSNSTAVVITGNLVDSVSNTSSSYGASASAVKTAYDTAISAYSNAVSTAASDASSKAATAYSNAVSYASNASNISSGTLSVARGGTGTGDFATAGIPYVNGTTAFTTATAAQIVSAIGTTKVANATYADSAGTAGTATSAGSVTNGVYTTGDQTIGGVKTFSSWILGATTSLSMSQDDGTTRGSFICKASGTGDANLAGMTFWNDAYAIKLGVRADGYFGLGGWSRAAWSWYSDPSGNMTAAGNVTAYSDPLLKENFQRVEQPFSILNRLDGGTFTWKDGFAHTACKAGKKDYGILADQVEAVMPEIVSPSIELGGETFRTVAYEKLVPVLIEAIKQLKQEVDDLRSKMQ